MKKDCQSCQKRNGRLCSRYSEMINLIKVEGSVLEFEPAKECENDNRGTNKNRA